MRRLGVVPLTLGVLFALGCKPERVPTREQRAEQRQAALAGTPIPAPPPPNVDDAELVTSRCGPPVSDRVLLIYDKINNGPVRRMVYFGKQEITFDFIPSVPRARATPEHETYEHFVEDVRPELPPGAVWRFDDARVRQADLLTSRRLKLYLPCASEALFQEY